MPISLLGTSHISPRSAKAVKEKIESGEVDIVAIELDRYRLQQLFDKNPQRASFIELAKVVGISGALFAKLGHYVQQKLGGKIGMEAGAEMKSAVLAAANAKIPIALIDRPIQDTLRRFSKAFNWREKLKLLGNAFKLSRVKFDLSKVPDDKLVLDMLAELKKASPALYKVLVEERNEHMSKALLRVEKNNPGKRILAVVGAGHLPGMKKILGNKEKEKNI